MARLGTFAAAAIVLGTIAVPPVALAQTVVAVPARPALSTEGPSGFSVVLVLGDLQAGGGSENGLPESARKALADMKDFLPYKSYRLLDTQWTRGAGPVTSHLRGPDNDDYVVSIAMNRFIQGPMQLGAATAGSLQSVRFTLSNAGGGPQGAVLAVPSPVARGSNRPRAAEAAGGQVYRAVPQPMARQSEAADVKAEIAQLERRLADVRAKGLADGHPDVVGLRGELEQLRARVDEVQPRVAVARPSRALIDTSFNMQIGETVVVGTSRLQGDKALIVLLTAVK